MTEISKEYAEALFMLAAEKNKCREYRDELSNICKIFEKETDLMSVLRSPVIPLSERLTLIDQAFSDNFGEHIVSCIKLLCERGRIELLFEVSDALCELVRISENRTSATVYYAEELTDGQKEALVQKLEKLTEKKIDATYIEDRSLIGGALIEVDGKVIDGSVFGRLKRIKGVIGK